MAQRHNPAVPVDLTHLTWSLSRTSTGTEGSFLKFYVEIDGHKVYEMVKDRVDWNDHAAASHEKVY